MHKGKVHFHKKDIMRRQELSNERKRPAKNKQIIKICSMVQEFHIKL